MEGRRAAGPDPRHDLTAGLTTGSPEKASANFLVFAFVMGWSAIISLAPFWKPLPPPPVKENQAISDLFEQGFRMGIGTALALAISSIAGFAKIGWAPSAVGNVVRYDEALSRKRAWLRFYGTLGGAALVSVALAFVTDLTTLVLVAAVSGVLNGLFKRTKLGMMPLFYTATILLLYSANDISSGENVLMRVFIQRHRHHHRDPARDISVPASGQDHQPEIHDRIKHAVAQIRAPEWPTMFHSVDFGTGGRQWAEDADRAVARPERGRRVLISFGDAREAEASGGSCVTGSMKARCDRPLPTARNRRPAVTPRPRGSVRGAANRPTPRHAETTAFGRLKPC